MKKFNLLVIIISLAGTMLAGEWVKISSPSPNQAKISLVSSDINTSMLQVSLDGYLSKSVKVNGQLENTISMLNGTPILKTGAGCHVIQSCILVTQIDYSFKSGSR